MSYHPYTPRPLRRPRARPAPQPPQPVYPAYPVQPLSSAETLAPNKNVWRGLLIAIAVVVGLLVLMYVLDRYFGEQADAEPEKPKRRRVEKMSTETLAKNLYKRLDKNGDASDATMNALRQIGKRK